MKRGLIFLLSIILSFTLWASYNNSLEKTLKKQYKEVKYLAHSDCYLVMSKQDKGYFGVINSKGEVIVEPYYKKIYFEKDENNGIIIIALNPNYKAQFSGNLVLNYNGKVIINLGKSEPQFIEGGYLTSYLKPIFNLKGEIVLDCQQTSVQPIRKGKKIIAYRVGTRTVNIDKIEDKVIVCDNNFNELFELDGPNYLWNIEEVDFQGNNKGWKCVKKGNEDELLFSLNGERINKILKEMKEDEILSNSIPIEDKVKNEEVIISSTPMPEKSKTIPQKNKSIIDNNIPVTNLTNDKTFVLIIGNENYHDVENVPNAIHDGEVFMEYCNKLLGIPKNNIHFVKDATLNNIRRELNLITQIAEEFNGEANVILYYAGHGIPDEKSHEPYIVPVDGYSSDITTCFSTSDLYSRLSKMSANKVIVFMDACFSGSLRGEGMLASARGISIKSNPQEPKGKMVIFSAAQGDETAYSYDNEKHGMFTYFLLKHLKDSQGDITLKDLAQKVEDDVRKQSLILNGKRQTPSVQYSPSIKDIWQEWKLNE